MTPSCSAGKFAKLGATTIGKIGCVPERRLLMASRNWRPAPTPVKFGICWYAPGGGMFCALALESASATSANTDIERTGRQVRFEHINDTLQRTVGRLRSELKG